MRNSIGWLSAWSEIVPSLEHLVPVFDQLASVGVTFVELGLLVFDHGLAVDDVLDEAVAVDFHFHRDPLVAVVGLGRRVGAVLGDQLALPSRCSCPACRRCRSGVVAVPLPPKNWTSIETGKSWSFLMLSGDWPWIMTPLLRNAQLGPPGHCFADEPILDAQPVVGKRRLVEQVAELVVELGILVVRYLQDPVLDAESITVVLAQVVAFDLGLPAVQVLAVEECDPALLGGRILPADIDARRVRSWPGRSRARSARLCIQERAVEQSGGVHMVLSP